jgi:hypothetical protein
MLLLSLLRSSQSLPRYTRITAAACAVGTLAACSGSSPGGGFGTADSGVAEVDAGARSDDAGADASKPSTGGSTPDAGSGETAAGGDATTSQPGTDAATAVDAGTPLDAGGGLVYPPFAAAGGTIDDGLAQLNLYRALVGLSTVALDAPSSTGCAAHLQYLICAAAAGGGTGYLEHTETGFPQCATDGGAQAGIASDLAWGESSMNRVTVGESLGQAVDDWMNGLYHRTPLLNPGLTKVGVASTEGYNCLDYAASGNTVAARAATPVLFPPAGTTDVPDTFGGNEGPCPTAPADPLTATTCPGSGFIVSANFYGWSTGNASAIGAVASVTLTDTAASAAVPLLAWYADTIAGHDPAPGYVKNEIALVPQASLAAGHSFSVAIQATVSGQPMNLSWSFTTGSRAP